MIINLRNLQRQRNVNQHIEEQCLARAMEDLANKQSAHFNLGTIKLKNGHAKVTFKNGHQVMVK